MRNCDSIDFKFIGLGEKRYVDWRVKKNRKNDTLVINEASWELFKLSSMEKESDGDCTVEGDLIRALISPEEVGEYILKINVEIPPEKIKSEVKIRVVN